MLDTAKIDAVTKRLVHSPHVKGVVLAVSSGAANMHVAAAGNLAPHERFYAASVSKLVTTIAIMQEVEAGHLALDDAAEIYLPKKLLAGLHVAKGVDRSNLITIRHLLANQTGIPDYFYLRGPDGKTHMAALLAGEDSAWPLERTLETVRGKRPHFVPGQRGRLDYSDTNYQLLGRVLEVISGKSIAALFADRVFVPLGLTETYVFSDIHDRTPAPFWCDDRQLRLPNYFASISAEGGMVTTASDLITLGRALFSGRLFALRPFLAQQEWRLTLRPGLLEFGMGLERLWTPWVFSPFKPIRDVMGFWGHTGAFLFHHAVSGLYIAGTVNQANGRAHPSAMRTMLDLIRHAGSGTRS